MAKRELTITGPMVIRSLTRGLGFSLFAGVIIAFTGPFGTFEKLSIAWRLGFWLSAIVGGFLFHMPLYWLARFVTESKGWPIWIAIIGSAMLAAFPTTILVNGIAISLLKSASTDSILTLYPMVLAISLPLQLIGHLTAFKGEFDMPPHSESFILPDPEIGRQAPAIVIQEPPIADLPPTTPPFFARLPGRLGKDLLCLQMEDHYVRAFTAVGSDMILMRMADAARELEGHDGLLVHRSFWVARSAVIGWTRDGKNLTLVLSNNKKIPVARDRQPQVKAAGWLVGGPG